MALESQFENITRRLDLNKASRDTTYDKSRGRSRVIKKVGYDIYLPSVTFNHDNLGLVYGMYVMQLNYTMPFNFRIINMSNKFYSAVGFTLCIRWHNGNETFRYLLRHPSDVDAQEFVTYCPVVAPLYTTQMIGANFSFEIWTGTNNMPVDNDIVTNAITFNTNRLRLPTSPDDVASTNEVIESADRDFLAINLIPGPEPIPTTYPNLGPWLPN